SNFVHFLYFLLSCCTKGYLGQYIWENIVLSKPLTFRVIDQNQQKSCFWLYVGLICCCAPAETSFTNTYSEQTDSTFTSDEENGLNLTTILIPVVVGVLIISIIVCGVIANRKWSQKATNKLLMSVLHPVFSRPMFEEDVPSVLELEMDELDQWIKKDSE
uniref:Transmembrane protein 154 n=1 Tax=Gouania willdenowi TaxID=441366 RepID=A0A8C5HAX1_GOUWI